MITKFGKRFLTSYIAGASDFNSKDLAIGIGNTAVDANGNDTKLEFEFYRLPVTLGSFDISQTGVDGGGNPIFAYTAIYKATVPQDVSGVISEIGLYPGVRSSNNSYDSKSGYSVNDSLSIAYKKNDNNVTAIRVKLYSSETQYYYADFTPSSGTGDKIQSISMSSVFSNISATAPDPTNITKVGVEVTAGSGGPTTVYFDGLRINDEDTFDPQYGLISRSVLTTPLQKPSGRPVDIEYKLQLEF